MISNTIDESYSTLELIDDLVKGITEIAPSNLVRVSGKCKGQVSKTWISKNIFNKAGAYLSKVRQWISNPNNDNYNPDFKFALGDLNNIIDNLRSYATEWRENIDRIIELKEKYSQFNNLKFTPHQQYDIYNPNLKEDFFSNLGDKIDSKKSNYWLGFLCADGYTQQGRQLGITLSHKDRSHLIKFCRDIGLDPVQKVVDFERELKGKTYKQSRVLFGCKPIINDLLALDYKGVPDYIKNSLDASKDPDALSWLFGLYDGDGQQGKTSIYSTKRDLLEQIRVSFNAPNKVYKVKNPRIMLDVKGFPKLDSHGDPMLTKTLYVLRLGPSLFNKMMDNYRDSMPRKRRYFDERIDAVEKLKKIFNNNKELLQELINLLPRSQILTILRNSFGISYSALKNLIDQWNINLPSVGYWNTREGKIKRQIPQWFKDATGYLGENP